MRVNEFCFSVHYLNEVLDIKIIPFNNSQFINNSFIRYCNEKNILVLSENGEYEITLVKKIQHDNIEFSDRYLEKQKVFNELINSSNLLQKNIIRPIKNYDGLSFILSFFSVEYNNVFNYVGESFLSFNDNPKIFINDNETDILNIYIIPCKLFENDIVNDIIIATEDVIYKNYILKSTELLNELKDTIAQKCMQLTLGYSSPVLTSFKRTKTKSKRVLYHDYLFLMHLFNPAHSSSKIKSAFESIKKNPQIKKIAEDRLVDISNVKNISPSELVNIASDSENLVKLKPENNLFSLTFTNRLNRLNPNSSQYKFFPNAIRERFLIHSNDTYENRFVKHTLKLCQELISEIENHNFNESFLHSENNDLIYIKEEISILLSSPFFNSVGDLKNIVLSSTVLQRRWDYREFLNLWILLTSVSTHSPFDAEKIESYDISYLYELFCFFKIKDFFDKNYKTGNNEIDLKNFYSLTNITIKDRLIELNYLTNENKPVKLVYQKDYSLYSNLSQNSARPDISIICGNDVWLFDPKYRTHSSNKDIFRTMHFYSDAIHNQTLNIRGVFAITPAVWKNKNQIDYVDIENNHISLINYDLRLIDVDSIIKSVGVWTVSPKISLTEEVSVYLLYYFLAKITELKNYPELKESFNYTKNINSAIQFIIEQQKIKNTDYKIKMNLSRDERIEKSWTIPDLKYLGMEFDRSDEMIQLYKFHLTENTNETDLNIRENSYLLFTEPINELNEEILNNAQQLIIYKIENEFVYFISWKSVPNLKLNNLYDFHEVNFDFSLDEISKITSNQNVSDYYIGLLNNKNQTNIFNVYSPENNIQKYMTNGNIYNNNYNIKLDETQQKILDSCVMMKTGNFAFIEGPPGTGKTMMLAKLAIELSKRGYNVLCTAFTHRAVSCIYEQFKKWEFEKFVYANFNQKIYNPESEKLITLTTLYKVMRKNTEYDVILIDESSQIKYTTMLLPLLNSKLNGRIYIFGDRHQLSPIFIEPNDEIKQKLSDENYELVFPDEYYRTSKNEPTFADSFMQKCIEDYVKKNNNFYKLVNSYRFGDTIAKFPSIEWYDNELKGLTNKNSDIEIYSYTLSTEECAESKLPNKIECLIIIEYLRKLKDKLLQISKESQNKYTIQDSISNNSDISNTSSNTITKESHTTNSNHNMITKASHTTNSNYNTITKESQNKNQYYNEISNENIISKSIRIISPFRKQNWLIKKMLMENNLMQTLDIQVETIDRFQGSEADIIIFSQTINDIDKFNFYKDSMFSENKFNVAITRAKEKLVFIVSNNIINSIQTQDESSYNKNKYADTLLKYLSYYKDKIKKADDCDLIHSKNNCEYLDLPRIDRENILLEFANKIIEINTDNIHHYNNQIQNINIAEKNLEENRQIQNINIAENHFEKNHQNIKFNSQQNHIENNKKNSNHKNTKFNKISNEMFDTSTIADDISIYNWREKINEHFDNYQNEFFNIIKELGYYNNFKKYKNWDEEDEEGYTNILRPDRVLLNRKMVYSILQKACYKNFSEIDTDITNLLHDIPCNSINWKKFLNICICETKSRKQNIEKIIFISKLSDRNKVYKFCWINFIKSTDNITRYNTRMKEGSGINTIYKILESENCIDFSAGLILNKNQKNLIIKYCDDKEKKLICSQDKNKLSNLKGYKFLNNKIDLENKDAFFYYYELRI